MDRDRTIDDMMTKLGEFSRYQSRQFMLHVVASLVAGTQMLSLVTVASVPDHRCWIEGLDSDNATQAWNSTEVLAAIPLKETGELHNCLMFGKGNQTITCDKWVFDTTYTKSSHAMEWNLVCSRRWMEAAAQSIYMIGIFCGVVILGATSDRWGRKPVLCVSAVFQLVIGILVAFVPNYWMFVIVRFLYGFCGSGDLAGFVLSMELIGPSKRTACGVCFQAAFSVGVMLVAGWGAIIDNIRMLQVIYGLHSLVLMPHYWYMDESIRWLWSQGKIKKSVSIYEKAMKFNESRLHIDRAQLVSKGRLATPKESNNGNTTDLFRTPNLRKKTLIICFCWFSNSLVYYGLSLNSGRLQGNPYVNLAIMGFVDIPSYALVIYLIDVWGRRTLVAMLMMLGGVACAAATLVPTGSTLSTSIVIIGKLFIAGSFAAVYNYTAELFPTVVRHSALGLGSTCSRLSASLSPLISLLDSFDPKTPSLIFGATALVSGFLCMFLPETMNQPLPQSLKDADGYGKYDTCFPCCTPNNGEDISPGDNSTDFNVSTS